eukprot:1453971-Amphidinium_carterae.2
MQDIVTSGARELAEDITKALATVSSKEPNSQSTACAMRHDSVRALKAQRQSGSTNGQVCVGGWSSRSVGTKSHTITARYGCMIGGEEGRVGCPLLEVAQMPHVIGNQCAIKCV